MTGPETGSPPSGPKFLTAVDRGLAHMDAVLDATLARLGTAIASPRTVRQADARTSIADLTAAAYLREGWSPDQLDRNGLPIRAGFTTT